MAEKKPLPKFQNEDEEARWYHEHRHELDAYFGTSLPSPVSLAANLGLKRSAPRPDETLAPTEKISLRLSHDDLDAVKAIAARKGLPYQTMLKGMIHEFVEANQ